MKQSLRPTFSEAGSLNVLALLELDLPPRVWLLPLLISERSIGMIAGPRGCGKSFLVLLIAYAIAAKKKLLPWGFGNGASVCYLDGEMTAHTIQARLTSIHARNTDQESRAGLSNLFHFVSPDRYGFEEHSERIGPIDTPEGQARIMRAIPRGTKLVIIDNKSAWTTGGREDAEAWAAIKGFVLNLRRQGMAILIVHHTNKAGFQRGTSAHEDLLDYSILLHHVPSGHDSQVTRFIIEHTKLREHLPELKELYEFSFWTDERDTLQFDAKPAEFEPSEFEQEVARLQEDGVSQAEIARRLKRHPSTVGRIVKKLKARQSGQA